MAKKSAKKKTTKKSAASKAAAAPTLSSIYDQVARRSDTDGVKINAAETKRVLACFFDVLEEQPPTSVAFDIIKKGLGRTATRKK